MKRTLRFLAIIFILFSLFSVNAFADEGEDVLEEFSGILPDGVDMDAEDIASELGIEAILGEIISAVSDKAGDAVGFFLLLIGFAVVISLSSHASFGTDGALDSAVEVTVCTVATASIFVALYDVCDSVAKSLTSAPRSP